MRHADVEAGIRAALTAGALTADAVALEARRAADQPHEPTPRYEIAQAEPSIPLLTERRLTHLPVDTRPLPTLTAYDQLLTRRPRTAEGEPR